MGRAGGDPDVSGMDSCDMTDDRMEISVNQSRLVDQDGTEQATMQPENDTQANGSPFDCNQAESLLEQVASVNLTVAILKKFVSKDDPDHLQPPSSPVDDSTNTLTTYREPIDEDAVALLDELYKIINDI